MLNLSDFASSGTSLPIGIITSFCGGYFDGGNNESFYNILGNTITDVNTALNHLGWYVCDGAEPGVILKSPIFNVAGRRLPNLIDKFILYGNSSGMVGGSATMDHIHTIDPHNHSMSLHYHINYHTHDLPLKTLSYSTGATNVQVIDGNETLQSNIIETSPPSELNTENSIVLSTASQSNSDNNPPHIILIPIMKVF